MKKYLYGLTWLCAGVCAAWALAAETPVTTKVEHHIYLHVIQPDADQPVRIIVADQAAPPAVTEKPASEEVDAEEPTVAEDTAQESEDLHETAVAEEPESEEHAELQVETGEEVIEEDPAQEVEALIKTLVAEESEALKDVVLDLEESEPVKPEAAADEPEAEPEKEAAEQAEPEEDLVAVADEDPAGPPEDKLKTAVAVPERLDPEPEAESRAAMPLGLLLFIFVLAIFLGFELISKVPSQLHTPLMSGSNAISGITIVGALAAAGLGAGGAWGTLLGTLAVAFATINVVGGYMVTNRMLAMFKKKAGGTQ